MGSWAAIERHVVEGGPGDSQYLKVCQRRPRSWEGAGEAVVVQTPAAQQAEGVGEHLMGSFGIERHVVEVVKGGEGLSVPSTQREAVGERLSEGGAGGLIMNPRSNIERKPFLVRIISRDAAAHHHR